MKKALLFITILLSVSTFSQRYPTFVSIRTGVSLPAKDFVGGISTVENGFALPGSVSIVEAAYFYNRHVGVGGLFSFNINPVDKQRYGSQFVINNERFSSVYIDSEPYVNTASMFGFYFDLPITNTYISFTSKLMAGFIWARNPTINFDFEYSGVASGMAHQPSENQSRFALYYGVGWRIEMSKRLSLKLNMDYTGSRFKFHYINDRKSGSAEKQVSYMACTVGISYSLY
ncbi:MAG: outer membrane beta-barrel protein [Bacteroidales bacterium]|nr:outer membrane beta-barrel protein [Bacteroidales bacterium]MCF8387469.1 outer membrane beta-barrel protein [Bacteroidales bacterium]MCF8398911.1 outer membrane beta-barrel protein [Bacteroidales bacterium]